VSTSDGRSNADYTRLTEATARAVRRDAEDDQPVQVVGYVPGTDRARAFPGDEKFPFVKDVPDVTGPDEYRKSKINSKNLNNPIPLTVDLSGYEVLPEIDIRGSCGLVLMGTYYPNFIQQQQIGGQGLLTLICEAVLGPQPPPTTAVGDELWKPIGVVNPTLVTPAIAPGYAYRKFYSSEFRLDPWDGYPPPPFPFSPPVEFTLVFDVSWYRKVRFKVADLVTDNAYLDLSYFRQR
jgi:hypothetical protein